MTNQAVWIGIAVGVFFAGIGIGYAMFQAMYSPANVMANNIQTMQQMMQDPTQRQQIMNQWMQNPQTMNDWMNQMMSDPQTMQQWHTMMMNNPQSIQQMHDLMMNDPNIMNSMANQMMSNPQFMNTMMGTMMQNPNFQQQYMGPWMMMRDSQFMNNMRGQWFQDTNLENSAVQTNQVSILANTWQYQSTKAFSPSVIKVSAGTTVTWTNDDTIIHTVTDLGNQFDSGFIQAGQTWQYTFDTKDNYYYFCSIHPWMRGTVIVS